MTDYQNKPDNLKKLYLGVAMASMTILFLSGISLSQHARSEPVSITVLPAFPKAGIPIKVTMDLNNPTDHDDLMSYELYANGRFLTRGEALLYSESSDQVIYVYSGAPEMGERITFLIKTVSDRGEYEMTSSFPAYPPQVWSSFVSFASFSTSLMGSSMGSSMGTSIVTTQFYGSSFTSSNTLNVGLIFSMILILLLVFNELSEPINGKGIGLRGLRVRFGRLSAILFVVFMGMVLTKIVLILG